MTNVRADRIEAAAVALLADVRRRYPGEALRCPFMVELDNACNVAREAIERGSLLKELTGWAEHWSKQACHDECDRGWQFAAQEILEIIKRGSHEPLLQLPVIENWAAFARESKDPAVRNMYADFKAVLEGASRDASNHDQGSLTEAGCSPAAQSCEWTATAGNPDDDSQRTGPADLVGALQDVVHTDPGPVRAAAAVKSIECPQCFGDKQIAMSDWTSRFCEYCGGTGRVALKSLEQPVATPGATQAEDAVIITAVSSGPRGLLASETASFAKTLARSPRIISRGASRGHHCLDCGADLSNHPTAASAHRCSPQRTSE